MIKSHFGNLEIDLDKNTNDKFIGQPQKHSEINEESNVHDIREDKDQSKFANENTMAKSNLR
jgi:hypothetical protein